MLYIRNHFQTTYVTLLHQNLRLGNNRFGLLGIRLVADRCCVSCQFAALALESAGMCRRGWGVRIGVRCHHR